MDCLHYTRMLKQLGIDVYFEEQGIHSIKSDAEFYISIYGTIAQSESENISANVKWGKLQSAKEGKVAFSYKNFLGYRKGDDGKPEIVPEEAEIVKMIYERFIAGDSLKTIAEKMQNEKKLSPTGKSKWSTTTIHSILSNEKYKGDAVINKTFTVDCLTKEVRKNNGERPKYYVENSHSAIIDAETFGRAQEEMARRTGKRKVKQVGTKTEQGKYSSKYALTEFLICGECRTPYRRGTWTSRGQKKIVWRCIKRLDYGKKYCHNSPTIDEDVLHKTIMSAIQKLALQNVDILKSLKNNILIELENGAEDNKSVEIQIKLAEIELKVKDILNSITVDTMDEFNEGEIQGLLIEKNRLQTELNQIEEMKQKRKNVKSRANDIYSVIDGLKNRTLVYDDKLVRQLLEAVIVESKEKIKIVFIGGYEMEQVI